MSAFREDAGLTQGKVAKPETLVEQVRKKSAWTAEALATLLEVSPKLIYKLVKTGKLNAYMLGTSVRIDGQDVADFLVLHATIPQRPQPARQR
jgi:excisionase family DNA binding protein